MFSTLAGCDRHRSWPTLYFERRGAAHGPHRAQQGRRAAGYTVLVNKYYLDRLYTDIIVGDDQGPDRPGGVLVQPERASTASSTASASARSKAADVRVRHVDQGVVDGVVNGSGCGAEGTGQLLRHIQTGKVQQYAASLFGRARSILAGILVFVV